MSWKDLIPGCFGHVDKKFALHHSDCQRAVKMLSAANSENVGWADYLKEIENWLISQKCSPEHIKEQMKAVAELHRYLNYD